MCQNVKVTRSDNEAGGTEALHLRELKPFKKKSH